MKGQNCWKNRRNKDQAEETILHLFSGIRTMVLIWLHAIFPHRHCVFKWKIEEKQRQQTKNKTNLYGRETTMASAKALNKSHRFWHR